jgi:hypothetical protein
MIEALWPVLLAKHKGTAKRAVVWLEQLAEREPQCKANAAGAAAAALAHEAADVQKAAIEVLQKHGNSGDAGLRKQVAPALAGVAASLRKRLEAWLGAGAAGKPAAIEKPRSAASAPSLTDL